MRFSNTNSRFGYGTNLDALEDNDRKVHIVYKSKGGLIMEKVIEEAEEGGLSCKQSGRQICGQQAGLLLENKWLVHFGGKVVGITKFN